MTPFGTPASSAPWWWNQRLQVTYEQTSEVHLRISPKDGVNFSHKATWGTMPNWWQKEQEDRFQVCSCGRSRFDSQNHDGYTKCESCRAEEHCVRCGHQKKVTNMSGRLICDACKPYEEMETRLTEIFTVNRRNALAAEATKLLAVQNFDKDTGVILLGSMLDHLSLQARDYVSLDEKTSPDRQKQIFSRFQSFFFAADGIYGSKFAPAALTILQMFPQLSGNSLVEIAAWLVGSFYESTQINGQKLTPSFGTRDYEEFQKLGEKLDKAEPVLAQWLQGKEKDRQEAVASIRETDNIVASLQHVKDKDVVEALHNQAVRLLIHPNQKFSEAVAFGTQAWGAAKCLKKVDEAIGQHLNTCPVCGKSLFKGECREGHSYEVLEKLPWLMTSNHDKEISPLVRLLNGKGEVVAELRVHDGWRSHEYHYGDVYLRTFPSKGNTRPPHKATAWDGTSFEGELTVQIMGNMPSLQPKQPPRDKVKIQELSNKLQKLEEEKSFLAAIHGGRVEITFVEGTGRSGRRLQSEIIFTGLVKKEKKSKPGDVHVYKEKPVVLVCNNATHDDVASGQSWICSLSFQLYEDNGVPVILVNPQARTDNEQAVRDELEALTGKEP